MDYFQLLAAFAVSLIATSLAVRPVRRVAMMRGWVDRPDGDRKLHREPIVCVGGIAILVGIVAGAIYLVAVANLVTFPFTLPSPFAVVGAAIIMGMGLLDDVRGLTFRTKFVVQIAAAYLLVMGGLRLDLVSGVIPSVDPEVAFFVSLPVTMLWIVGIVNAVNLVDGLDGLAAGLTGIAMSSFALAYAVGGEIGLVIMTLPIIGALAGFLVHNFNPASIFMGNSGSYLLGFLLAIVSIQSPAHADPVVSVMIVVVILGLPVLDTTYSFLRRYLNGVSPFAADSDHFHHRLMRFLSHRAAVIAMYSVGAALGTAGVVMASAPAEVASWVFAGMVLAAVLGLRLLGYIRLDIRMPSRSSRLESAQSPASHAANPTNGRVREPGPRFMRRIRTLESSSQA